MTIPNSIQHIDTWAFSGCIGLKQMTIPNSVDQINEGVFAHCERLTKITIPNSVTYIGFMAFLRCLSLTKITIPNSVTHIGACAFSYCESLTEITIPNSVRHIGGGVFDQCNHLKTILIDAPTEEEYQRIVNLLPAENHEFIIPFEICKAKQQALNSIVMGDISTVFKRLPKELSHLIHQYHGCLYDERLFDKINQVPLPRQPEELELYKYLLKHTTTQFIKQTKAINKLEKAIDLISSKPKKPSCLNRIINYSGFFADSQNAEFTLLFETQIQVIRKLITWLEGNTPVSFNEDDKKLLENMQSVKLILKDFEIEELPEELSLTYSS